MTSIPIEVSNFFLAMQAGKPGGEEMSALFAADAVYEEPFSGEARRHEGREAIMNAMAAGWETPMEDIRIQIDAAKAAGDEIHIEWTCFSPSIPGGRGSGVNRFRFNNRLIVSLITTLKSR